MAIDLSCKDTICALSSASGYGAIAIVRASGHDSLQIFQKIFQKHRGDVAHLKAMHGQVINEDQRAIDDVMAICFPKRASFTGEPSFEIYCHGNQLIIDQILETICDLGARLARPGEFALRAVLNGKIDLAQAESIADLIHAKSQKASQVALSCVRGGLKEKTALVQATVISTLAEMEARMDFPDEDLGSYDRSHLIEQLSQAEDVLAKILKNQTLALRLHDGARVVICGVPNAGKSTLLNQFLGYERAIVHETAGTTRDVIEAHMVLHGIPITLVDIAGIRHGDLCAVESIGISRAYAELNKADMVIWLADATDPHAFKDEAINRALKNVEAPVLKVLNKADLINDASSDAGAINISAKTGLFIEELKARLQQTLIGEVSDASEIYITKARQRDELKACAEALNEAHEALALGVVDEVVTAQLREAGTALDRLFGTTVSEDVLDEIFSKFCIGK